jgi:hypothetical protein
MGVPRVLRPGSPAVKGFRGFSPRARFARSAASFRRSKTRPLFCLLSSFARRRFDPDEKEKIRHQMEEEEQGGEGRTMRTKSDYVGQQDKTEWL